MDVTVLRAAPRAEAADGLTRFAAVSATAEPGPLGEVLAARRQELAAHGGPVFTRAAGVARAYADWFAAHGHVCPLPRQIETASRHGLRAVNPPVDALLLTEVTTGVLMGVQDRDSIDGGLRFDRARQGEGFTGFRSAVSCVAGEPVVRDGSGIVASVFQGPDRRTSAIKSTRRLVFTFFDAPGLPTADFDHAVTSLCTLLTEAGADPITAEVAL